MRVLEKSWVEVLGIVLSLGALVVFFFVQEKISDPLIAGFLKYAVAPLCAGLGILTFSVRILLRPRWWPMPYAVFAIGALLQVTKTGICYALWRNEPVTTPSPTTNSAQSCAEIAWFVAFDLMALGFVAWVRDLQLRARERGRPAQT